MAYLYDHPNPSAPVRTNGIRFWGYPQRTSPVRVIVIHTAENTPDTVAADGGAEAVAHYQTVVERPSSYHEIGDSDSCVVMLPPAAVAFGAKGANADGWHYSFATKAALWGAMPDRWVDGALSIGARRVAAAASLHGVPLVRITRRQWQAGASGLISHADVDPDRRSDPGAQFPWGRFLDLARDHQEDVMTPEQEAKLDRALELLDALPNRTRDATMGAGIVTDESGNRITAGVVLSRLYRRVAALKLDDPALIADAIVNELGSDVASQIVDELHRRTAPAR